VVINPNNKTSRKKLFLADWLYRLEYPESFLPTVFSTKLVDIHHMAI